MKYSLALSVLVVTLFFGSSVHAGGATYINKLGSPLTWDANASDKKITINPESGACGQFSNAQMATRLSGNLEEWTGITTVDLGFTISTGTIPAVGGSNYTDYLAGVNGNTSAQNTANVQDGLNPVLYDDDGTISDGATGESNGRFILLGFANPAGFSVDASDSTLFTGIVDGQAVFNCYCLDDGAGNPANTDCGTTVFSTDDLDFTMVHELGHMINLDHTQVNASLINDGDTANDDNLPTMYPVSVSAANQKTPMEDDITILSSLYPKSNFFTSGNSSSTYCKVTGTLKDRNGSDMRCVDMQFQGSDAFFNVAFVSGSYAIASDNNADNDTGDDGECTSNCGDFVMYLRPGRSYSLVASAINSSFVGGSGISPCSNTQLSECTSSSSTTTGCVTTETLTANSASEVIATKISTECTAGAIVALGNVASNSLARVSSTTTTTTTTGSGSSSSAGCALSSQGQSDSWGIVFLGLGSLMFWMIGRRKLIERAFARR